MAKRIPRRVGAFASRDLNVKFEALNVVIHTTEAPSKGLSLSLSLSFLPALHVLGSGP